MLQIQDPQKTIDTIVKFLQQTYHEQAKATAVIAVSGGIDSALALTFLCKALGPENVYPVFLPYEDQSTEDSKVITSWNNIPEKHWLEINIAPVVHAISAVRMIDEEATANQLRLGNCMARVRMILVYDVAKEYKALVCGTENKSEKYLSYFTRFGDEASDVEPNYQLYKTQVRQLAEFLELPEVFLQKPPSAGLWAEQTDESELGFSYLDADTILDYFEEKNMLHDFLALVTKEEIQQATEQLKIEQQTVEKVVRHVQDNAFKHKVPYVYSE